MGWVRYPLALLVMFAISLSAQASAWMETPALSEFEIAVSDAKSAMMTSPHTALQKAKAAEKLASLSSVPDALSTSLWLQAEALNRLNDPDAALEMVQKALIAFEGSTPKLEADIFLAQGRIARVLSQYGLALESFQSAFNIFDELEIARSKALALQGIGTLYSNAHQFDRVIEYNERAATAFSDGGMLDLVSLNNRANAYRELGDFTSAETMLTQALQMAEKSESDMLQVRILENIALLEIRQGNLDTAQSVINRGFVHGRSEEAKGWLPFLWGASAELAVARGDFASAKIAIGKAFADVDISATAAPYRDFHEAAYKIYSASGDYALAIDHFEAFKRLDDQGRDIAASANMAISNAQFELQNKELEIVELRATELEKNAALEKAQSEKRRLIVTIAFGLLLAVAGFILLAHLSIRKRHRQTKLFNEQLELKNDELAKTNIALETANQAKMEFLATTSHEIRTPLNAIIGMSEVVLSGANLDETNQEYLELVNSSGLHLLSIVNDILDVSKLEAGKLEPQLGAHDVSELVSDVANIWRSSAEQKKLTFSTDIDPSLGAYIIDDRLIRQVVSNLTSNAIKFSEEGNVAISLRKRSDGFAISISDTGIGIPPQKQKEIFEVFKQVDQSLQRQYEGTGLGLAICKKITLALGGDITLESTLGVGSTFTVILPAEKSETATTNETRSCADTSSDHSAAPKSEFPDLDILVAEDNRVNAMVIQAYLSGRCNSVTIVENGALAVEAVKDGAFDLVLMDKRMPEMSGIEATQLIRALPDDRADTPIIAVTADAFEGAREQALEVGVDEYIYKPITEQILWTAIDNTLAHISLNGRGGPRIDTVATKSAI